MTEMIEFDSMSVMVETGVSLVVTRAAQMPGIVRRLTLVDPRGVVTMSPEEWVVEQIVAGNRYYLADGVDPNGCGGVPGWLFGQGPEARKLHIPLDVGERIDLRVRRIAKGSARLVAAMELHRVGLWPPSAAVA